MLIGHDCERPSPFLAPQPRRLELDLVFGIVDQSCGLALDKKGLPSTEDVKVGCVLTLLARVLVLDGQRLFRELFDGGLVIEQVDKVPLDQGFERHHPSQLERRKVAHDVATTI